MASVGPPAGELRRLKTVLLFSSIGQSEEHHDQALEVDKL